MLSQPRTSCRWSAKVFWTRRSSLLISVIISSDHVHGRVLDCLVKGAKPHAMSGRQVGEIEVGDLPGRFRLRGKSGQVIRDSLRLPVGSELGEKHPGLRHGSVDGLFVRGYTQEAQLAKRTKQHGFA